MSAPEQQQESRSSVTLARNAKGEMQQTVKVYEGTEGQELVRMMELAVASYRMLEEIPAADTPAVQAAFEELRSTFQESPGLSLVPGPGAAV